MSLPGIKQEIPYCTACDSNCDGQAIDPEFIVQFAVLRRHGLFLASPVRQHAYFQVGLFRLFTLLRIGAQALGNDGFRKAMGTFYPDFDGKVISALL